MSELSAVGVREAKNRFSELTAQVNELGSTLVVLKNNRPWVTIHPADPESASRRERLERFHSLTASIEQDVLHEPAWPADKSDRELLDEEILNEMMEEEDRKSDLMWEKISGRARRKKKDHGKRSED